MILYKYSHYKYSHYYIHKIEKSQLTKKSNTKIENMLWLHQYFETHDHFSFIQKKFSYILITFIKV